MTKEYQICTRCIMDTSDPEIQFDQNGICNHCRLYETISNNSLFHSGAREKKLKQILNEIKKSGKGRQYDCIIGVSGGVDSTYVAYLVKKMGLRPLAVHVDNGWNSELAVGNIEKVLKKLNIDLYTHVINWKEFRDLQLSFLKASTPDSEIPTDHAIVAILQQMAKKIGVKYVISGSNIETEAILPRRWSYGHSDWRYIRSVQRKFSKKTLQSFPHYSMLQLLYFKIIKRQHFINILNYTPYIKKDALKILEDELGWRNYGGKHYESVYTRFFQGYILPKKFKIDKRRAHLSTLICSGQMNRSTALLEIKEKTYSDELMNEDREFVIKKLGIDEAEFNRIMQAPKKTFWDYPNYESHFLIKIFYYFTLTLNQEGVSIWGIIFRKLRKTK